jgi:hypothetical protein
LIPTNSAQTMSSHEDRAQRSERFSAPRARPARMFPPPHHVLSTGTLIILLKALTGGFQSTLVI